MGSRRSHRKSGSCASALKRETMAREDCALCKGTGWKLVPRKDGAAGQMAVACECGMEERAEKGMERARVPKRYEHCDFESYATDLADGKTWITQHKHALKHAKLMHQRFVRDGLGARNPWVGVSVIIGLVQNAC